MSLKGDKQQNIQIELDFSSAPTGEAREAGREGTEPSGATSGAENPASMNRWMEAVGEREYRERYLNHSGRRAFAKVLGAIPGRNQLPECGAPMSGRSAGGGRFLTC
jgi:hypothetical protein